MRVAICDDEKICREILLKYLNASDIEKDELDIAEFDCGEKLLAQYKNDLFFDLIFLDVEMKGISGVETGKQIREFDKTAIFIFVTNHQQYVQDAFILKAYQFLVKPVKQDFFIMELERAYSDYKKMKYQYEISFKDETTYLETREILCIETYGRRLRAITLKGDFDFLGKLSKEEKLLSSFNFIRCHKCYLVNMKHIQKVHQNDFTIDNGDKIPISKNGRNDIISQFNRFVSGSCI